jgi:hypothetical protein
MKDVVSGAGVDFLASYYEPIDRLDRQWRLHERPTPARIDGYEEPGVGSYPPALLSESGLTDRPVDTAPAPVISHRSASMSPMQ